MAGSKRALGILWGVLLVRRSISSSCADSMTSAVAVVRSGLRRCCVDINIDVDLAGAVTGRGESESQMPRLDLERLERRRGVGGDAGGRRSLDREDGEADDVVAGRGRWRSGEEEDLEDIGLFEECTATRYGLTIVSMELIMFWSVFFRTSSHFSGSRRSACRRCRRSCRSDHRMRSPSPACKAIDLSQTAPKIETLHRK